MLNYTYNENKIIDKYNNSIAQIDGISFMNDGYVDIDQYGFPIEPNNFILSNKFQPWRYQAKLYQKCLDVAEIKTIDKYETLLDSSCGKGGGLEFIKEYYNFKKLIGVDINPAHIEICKKHVSQVEFISSSATNIPLQDLTIDIILSVEASSYYDPFKKYLEEAYRLLKPSGLLIQANPNLHFKKQYSEVGFKLHSMHNITKNVRVACSISKYVMAEFDPSGTLFECLLGDESRYTTNKSEYNIMIVSK